MSKLFQVYFKLKALEMTPVMAIMILARPPINEISIGGILISRLIQLKSFFERVTMILFVYVAEFSIFRLRNHNISKMPAIEIF